MSWVKTHPITCELPNTDALRALRNEKELAELLEELGNPLFERVGDKVTIPAFAAGRAKYSAAKQIDCDRWGCE